MQNPLKITIENTEIKNTDKSKFLGIWVDSNLSWDEHVLSLTNKLSRISYAMRVLSRISTMEVLRTVYFGYIHSIISYCIPFWGGSSKATNVFKHQKRIIKIMKQVPIRTHSKGIFKELNILPLPCVYILETVCFIHNNKQAFQHNDQFHTHNTRTSSHLHLTHHRLNISINNVSHKGVILYNKFPNNLKVLAGGLFKKKVKKILLQHQFFTVDDFINFHF